MDVKALVVSEKDAPFEMQDVELADPGRGEVRVRIVATGVCHTDAITRAGDMPMPFPSILGHEGSGVVDAVAEGDAGHGGRSYGARGVRPARQQACWRGRSARSGVDPGESDV